MQISSDYKSNINKLARGLMSYKVEIPRLVTMKKWYNILIFSINLI